MGDKMKRLLLGLALAVMLAGLFSVNSFACDFGCTPGYWKQSQHFDSWEFYTPNQLVCDVFTCPAGLELKNGTPLASATLLQALNSGGGGLDALLRHAIAALLNGEASVCEWDEDEVIVLTNGAIAGNRRAMEVVKNLFEAENEEDCPLN